MRPNDFWDMTPREFDHKTRGWGQRREMQHKETAWQTCILINCCGNLRRPVRMEEMLGTAREGPRDVTKEEKENFEIMKEKFGG